MEGTERQSRRVIALRPMHSISFFKSVGRVAIPATLLIIATLVFDLASASVYVYPEHDFGQSGFTLIVLFITWIATAIYSIICLWKKRFFISLFVFAALCAPIALANVVDRVYWKFSNSKGEYLNQIEQDAGPSPKYKVFDWGNRNISIGGGVQYEAVVFDESDDLVRPSGLRSPTWRGNAGLLPPGERWITADPPECKREVRSLGGHFYYIMQECDGGGT